MTILHIDSSITGDHSASRKLSAAVIERLRREDPAAAVEYRDLVAEAIPHLTLDRLTGPETNDDLRQFFAVDTIVIGAPLYNFGISSQLKAWIDRLLVPGQTFTYGDDGKPKGLVDGKRVILAIARGGLYGPGSGAEGMEHVESYLRGLFGFIGVTDIEVVVADGLKASADGPDAVLATALAKARGE